MYWAYLATFVLTGIALDWAFFARMQSQFEMFRPIKDGFGYRDLLFPRVFLTGIAALITGVGALQATPDATLIIFGVSLFALSHLYANYKIWRFGRRR